MQPKWQAFWWGFFHPFADPRAPRRLSRRDRRRLVREFEEARGWNLPAAERAARFRDMQAGGADCGTDAETEREREVER